MSLRRFAVGYLLWLWDPSLSGIPVELQVLGAAVAIVEAVRGLLIELTFFGWGTIVAPLSAYTLACLETALTLSG